MKINVLVMITIINILINDIASQTSSSTFICDNTKEQGYKIGDEAIICIHILPSKYRIGIKTKVDDYQMVTVSGSYLFADKDPALTSSFIFQFQNATSPYESTFLTKPGYDYTPLFNVVIKLNNGVVSGISWDNDCWDCGFGTSGYKCKAFNHLGISNSTLNYTENVSKQELNILIELYSEYTRPCYSQITSKCF